MPRNWYSIEMKADSQETASISIYDAIGATWEGEGVTAEKFIADINAMNAKEVTLYVNSPGGSVFDGIAIQNAIAMHPAKFTGKVMGVAASAASLVLTACDKVQMPRNTFQMLHNTSSLAWGTAADMRETASVLDVIDNSMHATYAAPWLSAEDCVAMGLAHEVLDPMPVEAKFDPATLPEAVRAVAFKAKATTTPPEPKADPVPQPTATTPLAETVKAAAVAAGLAEYAAHFALSIDSADKVQPAINHAREIAALCAVGGRPEMARALITASAPLAEVRTAIVNARADASDAQDVNTAPKNGGEQPPVKVEIKTADIYAARRKSN